MQNRNLPLSISFQTMSIRFHLAVRSTLLPVQWCCGSTRNGIRKARKWSTKNIGTKKNYKNHKQLFGELSIACFSLNQNCPWVSWVSASASASPTGSSNQPICGNMSPKDLEDQAATWCTMIFHLKSIGLWCGVLGGKELTTVRQTKRQSGSSDSLHETFLTLEQWHGNQSTG